MALTTETLIVNGAGTFINKSSNTAALRYDFADSNTFTISGNITIFKDFLKISPVKKDSSSDTEWSYLTSASYSIPLKNSGLILLDGNDTKLESAGTGTTLTSTINKGTNGNGTLEMRGYSTDKSVLLTMFATDCGGAQLKIPSSSTPNLMNDVILFRNFSSSLTTPSGTWRSILTVPTTLSDFMSNTTLSTTYLNPVLRYSSYDNTALDPYMKSLNTVSNGTSVISTSTTIGALSIAKYEALIFKIKSNSSTSYCTGYLFSGPIPTNLFITSRNSNGDPTAVASTSISIGDDVFGGVCLTFNGGVYSSGGLTSSSCFKISGISKICSIEMFGLSAYKNFVF